MQYSLPLLDLILVGARLAGMIFAAPFFGSRNYPIPVKIGLVLFSTILINPLVTSNILYDVSNIWDFAYHLTNEIFIGLFIGIILTVYFNFVYFAGDIIDRDLGFAMVNVVNPMDESQIPITANLFYIFSILIFLQLNLHHQLITALVVSYERIPLGSNFFAFSAYTLILEILAQSFVIGFQVAAPFIITVLIANIILGLLAKAMPGMNVFILGMPFKIFFGFLLFIMLMPFYYEIFSEILHSGFYYVQKFFSLFP